MIVYAFDDTRGLRELEAALRKMYGDSLIFKGFTDIRDVLAACKCSPFDVVFADVEIQNRNGMILLGELHWHYPYTNFIGTATREDQVDALTLHRIHAGGYLMKPFDANELADTMAHLRYAVREHSAAV